MTCEQIRETVDATNQGEVAARHLSACGACRKETAATASLVSLLRAQPKVKAPADFMAQLQLRMATEAVSPSGNENARLKSLLQAVPAVAAPPDFAFRVRARLAQAKADATANTPLLWLQNWFANSFSFGQAATAMAAVALIAVFTIMQLRNDGSGPNAPMTSDIAQVSNPPLSPVVSDAKAVSVARLNVPKPTRSVRPAYVGAPAAMFAKAEVARALPTEAAEPAMYSPKSKQEVRIGRDGNAYGQQLRKMMDAQRSETMIAAF